MSLEYPLNIDKELQHFENMRTIVRGGTKGKKRAHMLLTIKRAEDVIKIWSGNLTKENYKEEGY